MFTYLALNLFTVSIPLIRSFEKRINYYSKFKALFTAILITAVFFIVWDFLFTSIGVWEFNPNFVIGIYIFGLPLEEWLFFVTVPFACIFIYETIKYFYDFQFLNKYFRFLFLSFGIILLAIAFFNTDKIYTLVTFCLTSFLLIWVYIKKWEFISTFFLTYIVSLIPFFLINGLLTSLPVVSYNNQENLSFRIFSIPVEDAIYMLLLLLINVILFEYFKRRWNLESR